MDTKTQEVLLKIRKGATAAVKPAQMIKLGVFEACGLHAELKKLGRNKYGETPKGFELMVWPIGEPANYKKFNCYLDWRQEDAAKKAGEVVQSSYSLFPWLKKEFDFEARVNQALGMEPHIPANRRSKDGTGTCPICFRNIKLSDKLKMVNHGYTQDYGRGVHRGDDCVASGSFQPYELSKDGCEYALGNKIAQMGHIANAIAEVKKKLDCSQSEDYPRGDFKDVDHFRQLKYEASIVKAETDFYQEMITNWKVRPLPKEGEPLASFVK